MVRVPGDSFDEISQAGGLIEAVGDRKDVDLDRHGGCRGQLRLGLGAEDRLRGDHDDLGLLDDLTGRAGGVLQLGSPHQPASGRTSRRCSSGSRPDMGETSRISMESHQVGLGQHWGNTRNQKQSTCRENQ